MNIHLLKKARKSQNTLEAEKVEKNPCLVRTDLEIVDETTAANLAVKIDKEAKPKAINAESPSNK